MSLPEQASPTEEADHREFLYMGIGWMLMDLRQSIEFDQFVLPEWQMTRKEICDGLARLQRMCGDYADKHFPHEDRPVKGGEF